MRRVDMSSEKPAEHYDEVYARGGHNGFYFADPLDASYYTTLWVAAASLVPVDGRIVDLGCGPGQFAAVLRSITDVPYVGYDFSGVAIQQARARKLEGCIFERTSFQKLDLSKDTQFVCLEVLEHIEQDIELLKRLPSKATLVFSVPTYDSAGHVRTFPSVESIKERYGPILDMELVQTIQTNTPTGKIFLLRSTRL